MCRALLRHAVIEADYLCYSPQFREFGLYYHDGDPNVRGEQSISIQLIEWCPFCGAPLPSSLRDLWFERMYESFGKSDLVYGKSKVPREYESDLWWRRDRL